MTSKLEMLFAFQEKNPEYMFVKLKEDIHDRNEFWRVGDGSFGNTSGIAHYLRFGVAPKKDIYSVNLLTNFLKYFDEKMETSKENSLYGSDFAIEDNTRIFSKKGIFTRGERSLRDTLDFTAIKRTEYLFDMNDKYISENKGEELKKLHLISRTISEQMEKEKASRDISLRFFPSIDMLNYTQNTETHSHQKYTSQELIKIIGKENCNKLFNWTK